MTLPTHSNMPDKVKPHENYKFPIHDVQQVHKDTHPPAGDAATLVVLVIIYVGLGITVLMLVLTAIANL